jgi:hypothetical protein
MKAEQRKEIETNSLILTVQKLRQRITGRTVYYIVGTIALIVAGILLYYYFAGESKKARDAVLLQLANADTPEKLKEGMESHRGTVYGSLFKLDLARYQLRIDGIPRLGTENSTARQQAANSVEEARNYFLELTSEFKEKEEPALVQEAWLGAAEAEEALVGLPTPPKPDGTTELRGNVDKTIQYYDNAGDIFPDTEFSKRYKARADKIRANKEQFVADQKAIYKPVTSLFGPTPPKAEADPPLPKTDTPPVGPSVPPPPVPPPVVDPKSTEPKPGNRRTHPMQRRLPIPSHPNPQKGRTPRLNNGDLRRA